MSEQFDKLNHWYGWNGGECPVHPETEVEVILCEGGSFVEDFANGLIWDRSVGNYIIAFRIIKIYVEPKKPREWWINVYAGDLDGCSYTAKDTADEASSAGRLECVHVREVLPEDEA